MAGEDERAEAHAELARERWDAHHEKHRGEKELSEQKWESHAEFHESIARSLVEYKAQSNEWRGSLSDLRATFASRAEHDSLESRVNQFRDELRAQIATEREERREQQNLRTGATDTWKYIVGFLGVGGIGSFLLWLSQQAK